MIERWKRHPYAVVIGYFLVYTLCFSLLEAWPRTDYHVIHCFLDDYIPFCKYAVVPYVIWFGWVPGMLLWFLYRRRAQFWRCFLAIAGGSAVSLVLYALFPTGLRLRHVLPATDVFNHLVRLIYSVDTSTNVCPSLHVYVTVILLLSVYAERATLSRRFLAVHSVIAACICASTVLIDQHSLVDVICGLALAVCMHAVMNRRDEEPAPHGEAAEPARGRALL